MKPILKPRQQRFADEYLIDGDATAAYIRAGFKSSGKAASVGACKLLARPQVQARIKQRQARIARRLEIAAEDIIAEVAALAFFVLPTGEDGAVLPVEQWPEGARKMIAGFDVDQSSGAISRVKLASKLDALLKLGHQHGLFSKEVKHSGGLKHTHDVMQQVLEQIDGADVGIGPAQGRATH